MSPGDRTNPPSPTAKNAASSAAGIRRLQTSDIFCGDREVIIDHAGQEYRLRITATGKLILTK